LNKFVAAKLETSHPANWLQRGLAGVNLNGASISGFRNRLVSLTLVAAQQGYAQIERSTFPLLAPAAGEDKVSKREKPSPYSIFWQLTRQGPTRNDTNPNRRPKFAAISPNKPPLCRPSMYSQPMNRRRLPAL